MLHILFLILKIIGIILLAILGILIVLLCVVLFVPVRYQLEAETPGGIDKLSVHAEVFWLMHLIYGYYYYKEQKAKWQVRIGWWKLNKKKEREETGPRTDSENASDDVASKNIERTESVEETKSDKKRTRHMSRKAVAAKKKQNWFQKFKCTVRRICDKIKALLETKERVVDFLTDERHVAAFQRVKKEITILAKHIRPRTIKGKVRFGLKDPYHTGQILAALSVLYPFYGEHVAIYPDFEHEVLEGNISMKGRISVIRFVTIVCHLYFDKNIKQTYKNYKLLKS